AREQHQEALDVLADEFDIPVERRLLIDEAPEYAMQKLEIELKADLVIVGAVSRSIVTDVFVGSTTEKVLDFLDCDALLLRPD
ncbi:MAG: universal stress protein, partial [Pseudomonadales bacterium]